MTNENGARQVEAFLASYVRLDKNAPKEQHVADLLRDIRHYCDVHGLDFAECDRAGRMEYRDDLAEQAHA